MTSSLLPWFSMTVPAISFCHIPPIPYTVEYHSELESESLSYSSSQHCAMSVESQRWKYIAFSDPRVSKIHLIASSFLRQFLATALNVYWNII